MLEYYWSVRYTQNTILVLIKNTIILKIFGNMKELINILDLQMETPGMYGWFHLMFFALSIIAGIILCVFFGKAEKKTVNTILLSVSILVILLEVYKQFNYSFSYEEDKLVFDYQWYAFPFQFCSTPMFVGLIAGILRKGRVHDALCAYLATFAFFAGACVMFYPADVFIGTIGINIQTMICHGSMISIAVYLLYTGYVKREHKTILKAIPVFAVMVIMAVIMNEIAYQSGLLESETFNMFFISPYCEPSLPVYSQVQAVVPFPWCLFIYVAAFSLAAYIILLLSMLIEKIAARAVK